VEASQKSIFIMLKKWLSRIDVKCFQCGNIYKVDKEKVEQFAEVQKNQGIEEALKLDTGIVCSKCKTNRWAKTPKKKFEFKINFNFRVIRITISNFLSKVLDVCIWFLAWLEYRRQVLLKNWWFDYKSIVCRGGALIGLLSIIYVVTTRLNIEFYQSALTVAILYGIIKFSKN